MKDGTREITSGEMLSHPKLVGIESIFRAAFSDAVSPFSWQAALAEDPQWPEVLIAPTGSGKTAGVTLAWLFHRLHRPNQTPRRLVWCLPMRTLVNQTATAVREWLQNLGRAGIDSNGLLPRPEEVFVLMGGATSDRWLNIPERPAIIVGTQDMLLSRALMRGYACSRSLWPMQFGLLHQDVQWVYDEVQLMGAGRATSAQLEAFRRKELSSSERIPSLAQECRSLWVSATLEPEWLTTVDFDTPNRVVRVNPKMEEDAPLRSLVRAPKHLRRSGTEPESAANKHFPDYIARLADAVVRAHRAYHMTLVIVNQVNRAQNLYSEIKKNLSASDGQSPEVVLLHSRFRPAERDREMGKLPDSGVAANMIVIATQAVEAGVDISAAVLFAELAPWASMVQRFGRANRRAEVKEGAVVYWIDILACADSEGKNLDEKKKKQLRNDAIKISQPYRVRELRDAREKLRKLVDVAPVHLPPAGAVDSPLQVVRHKDLIDLFDTDSDLTGFDLDISAYVRDADDTDIRVFWRELSSPENDSPRPNTSELCAVPIQQARTWMTTKNRVFFVRDPQWKRRNGNLDENPLGWVPLRQRPTPGMTVLALTRAGGYDMELGFTGNKRHIPLVVDQQEQSTTADMLSEGSDRHDDDPESVTGCLVGLSDHLGHVATEARKLCKALRLDISTELALTRAGRWHDVGKAHSVFQSTMRRGLGKFTPPESVILAKTAKRSLRHERAYFRHELASALAFLAHEEWSREADLIAYLIASHHGKMRMNMRALPRESPKTNPDGSFADMRFARGVWEGDHLPAVSLGGIEDWEGGSLTLSIMELGWDDCTRESWTERTRDLLAKLGPFQLAYLEALLRIADWRASRKEECGRYEGT